MPLIAVCAVLLAACMHAAWNIYAKQAANSKHFVWMYSLGSILLWGPAVAWLLWTTRPQFEAVHWLALLATSTLHLGYSLALQAGYRAADLSVVYPVARGSGPVLSFIGAALLLGERPGPIPLLGLLLVVLGIIAVADLTLKLRQTHGHGLAWGLLTGSFIAGYTLNDGWAVKVLLIHPLLIDYTGNLFRFVVLTPKALARPGALRAELRTFYRPALVVSALAPLGYLLVLFAMKIAPISHVAPMRELATLIGTYFGARILSERVSPRRILGASCIVAGVICLALSP